jgi:hypothetical protein
MNVSNLHPLGRLGQPTTTFVVASIVSIADARALPRQAR